MIWSGESSCRRFGSPDPLADAQVTLRDCSAHRTGIGRHELLWSSGRSRCRRTHSPQRLHRPEEASAGRVRIPERALRDGGLRGQARQPARPGRTLVRRRIVTPLGMKRTTLAATGATPAARDNAAPAAPQGRGGIGRRTSLVSHTANRDPAGSIPFPRPRSGRPFSNYS